MTSPQVSLFTKKANTLVASKEKKQETPALSYQVLEVPIFMICIFKFGPILIQFLKALLLFLLNLKKKKTENKVSSPDQKHPKFLEKVVVGAFVITLNCGTRSIYAVTGARNKIILKR